MSNETIKRFDITIKLRGDNVYDLYMDGEWIASRGSCENIVDEGKDAILNIDLVASQFGAKDKR